MSLPVLRDYQKEDLKKVSDALFVHGHRSVLLVQPTGAGKGTLASYIVHSVAAKGKRTLFLVNRRALVHDMAKRLDRLGVDHGVIMGGDSRRKPWAMTHVASIDTLRRREHKPKASILILDEAHFAVSEGWRKVLDMYPEAKVLCLTATPCRLDGKGLGEIADVLVQGPSVRWLIDRGHLVPSRVFAPPGANTSGVKITAGEYNQKSLSDACDKVQLIGDIVKHWKLHAADRKTVIFGVDQKHAQHIAEEFRCAGVPMAYVDANTPDDEREKIWDDLDNGSLPGLASVGVVSYGWDHPRVSCVVLARPTASVGLYLQQVGRGSRPYPGKSDLLVLDHTDSTRRFGFYEDDRQWSLDGKALKCDGDDLPAVNITTCKNCYGTFRSGPRECPYCGAEIEIKARKVEVLDGDLEELSRAEAPPIPPKPKRHFSWPEKRRLFNELRDRQKKENYKDQWVSLAFNSQVGHFPPGQWMKAEPDEIRQTLNQWDTGEL